MTGANLLRAQAYNNAWANHRLLKACAVLPPEALHARRTGFFPSIIHTLNHILTVDWFYVSALEGRCIGYAAFDPEIPHLALPRLDAEQRQVDQRLIAVCDGLDDAGLDQVVELRRDTNFQHERKDRVLLHLFQHQVHHRGQVHTMLSGTSTAPPQLDEFFLDADQERQLRQEDFVELGFDEARIWRRP
jgi:uncharacterized damage-inducible protein DinB